MMGRSISKAGFGPGATWSSPSDDHNSSSLGIFHRSFQADDEMRARMKRWKSSNLQRVIHAEDVELSLLREVRSVGEHRKRDMHSGESSRVATGVASFPYDRHRSTRRFGKDRCAAAFDGTHLGRELFGAQVRDRHHSPDRIHWTTRNSCRSGPAADRGTATEAVAIEARHADAGVPRCIRPRTLSASFSERTGADAGG